MYTARLKESETLTKTAQALTEARLKYQRNKNLFGTKDPRTDASFNLLAAAQAAYKAAYKAYTNPFDTQKTFS